MSLLLCPVSAGRFDGEELFIKLLLRLLRIEIGKLLRIKRFGENLHRQHVIRGIVIVVPDAKTAAIFDSFQGADAFARQQRFQAGAGLFRRGLRAEH
ncbi:hypothetical protein D3C80_1422720 [compost metagenome]